VCVCVCVCVCRNVAMLAAPEQEPGVVTSMGQVRQMGQLGQLGLWPQES
jgi:hypothetical protein